MVAIARAVREAATFQCPGTQFHTLLQTLATQLSLKCNEESKTLTVSQMAVMLNHVPAGRDRRVM